MKTVRRRRRREEEEEEEEEEGEEGGGEEEHMFWVLKRTISLKVILLSYKICTTR